jgi:hypothetical protein
MGAAVRNDRTGFNKLTVVAYSGAGEIPNSKLERAEGLSFSTVYPGGVFAACSFFVPHDITRGWAVTHNQRIVVYNGLNPVWEGYVTVPGLESSQKAQGRTIEAIGAWSNFMKPRKWRKPWCDVRLSDDVWRTARITSAVLKPDKFTEDRDNRLYILPKSVSFNTNELYAIDYRTPTGETIKRVRFVYDFAKPAQTWTFRLRDNTNVLNLWSVTSTGAGTADITLGTVSSSIAFQLVSGASQTGVNDGTYYAKATDISVYTETGTITPTVVFEDVAGKVGELSSTTALIQTNALTLEPFYSEVETLEDILINAASYGGTAYEPWGYGILESDKAPDRKPPLFFAPQPVLNDTEYVVSLGDQNLAGSFRAAPDKTSVRNWIAVEYKTADGKPVWVTPDDDSSLKDQTSIDLYGQQEEWLSLDSTDLTAVTNYAKTYLDAYKDPEWQLSGGIQLHGYVRTVGGAVKPVSEVRAGERIRITDFLPDLSGTGMTFLISSTRYDDNGEVNTLSVGRYNSLDVFMARWSRSITSVKMTYMKG